MLTFPNLFFGLMPMSCTFPTLFDVLLTFSESFVADDLTLNIQGCSVCSPPPLHAPSRAPLLLPLLLSHNIPLPRVHYVTH